MSTSGAGDILDTLELCWELRERFVNCRRRVFVSTSPLALSTSDSTSSSSGGNVDWVLSLNDDDDDDDDAGGTSVVAPSIKAPRAR